MRRRRIFIGILLLLHTLLIGWIAVRKSPVVDEFPHLVAGISHWEFGTFELYPVNPPLVRMAAALPVFRRLRGARLACDATQRYKLNIESTLPFCALSGSRNKKDFEQHCPKSLLQNRLEEFSEWSEKLPR